jgi:small-conductance mechanosensitive channel
MPEFLSSFPWPAVPNADDSRLLHLGLSVLIVIVGMLAVRVVNRFFRSRQTSNPASYRVWAVATRNIVGAIVFVLLLGIWVSELKSVAISLAAFAAGLLISGKEMVMCVLGAFMRMTARTFQLGDTIRVGDYAGEVVDMDLMTTTLLEISPGGDFTGSTIRMPNGMLLTHPVIRHAAEDGYALETLRVPVPPETRLADVEARLLAATDTACAAFMDQARHALHRLGGARFVDPDRFEPSVSFEPIDVTQVDAILRFPAKIGDRSAIVREILKSYYAGQP